MIKGLKEPGKSLQYKTVEQQKPYRRLQGTICPDVSEFCNMGSHVKTGNHSDLHLHETQCFTCGSVASRNQDTCTLASNGHVTNLKLIALFISATNKKQRCYQANCRLHTGNNAAADFNTGLHLKKDTQYNIYRDCKLR